MRFAVQIEVSTPDRSRPADLLVLGGGRPGRPPAIDVSVVTPKPNDTDLGCVASVEREKVLRYQALCDSVGWDFSPFVITSFGSFGPSAITLLDQ